MTIMIEFNGTYRGISFVVYFTKNGWRSCAIQVPVINKALLDDLSCHNGIARIGEPGGVSTLTEGTEPEIFKPQDGLMWIEFDCNGPGDLRDMPSLHRAYPEMKGITITDSDKKRNATIKDTQFCVDECKHIINQFVPK